MRTRNTLLSPEEWKLFEHTFLVRHRLEEQYEDLNQQSRVAAFGMWVFLATEVMFFGTLFVTVGVLWLRHPEAVETASERLNWMIGGINTLVLLVSSFTMALSVHFARIEHRRALVTSLLATALLGVAFLGLKALEYYLDYREYLIPGWRFRPEEWIERGLSADQVGPVKLFLLMYWIMTSIHAVHLTIGIAVVVCIAWWAHRGTYSAAYHSPVEVTGLYWHFVDLVWIFLLPMLYQLGTHSLAG